MKKIFLLCMAGALALAATACDDKNDKGGSTPPEGGNMIINDVTANVGSAFCIYYPGNDQEEADYDIYLYKDVYTYKPEHNTFRIIVDISESCFGKTLDLTKVLDRAERMPYLFILGNDGTKELYAAYNDELIDADVPVVGGTLKVIRKGENFTIDLNDMLFQDGSRLSVKWSGKPSFKTVQ